MGNISSRTEVENKNYHKNDEENKTESNKNNLIIIEALRDAIEKENYPKNEITQKNDEEIKTEPNKNDVSIIETLRDAEFWLDA
jgi:hypothetical protein